MSTDHLMRDGEIYAFVQLTHKEEIVVLHLILGRMLSNKEIANSMNISTDTVKFHFKNIMRKTQLTKRYDIYSYFSFLENQGYFPTTL